MLPQPDVLSRPVPFRAPCPAGTPMTGALGTALALAMMRHVVQPVILMDPDGRVTQVNPAGLALIPPQAGVPQGHFWWELWPHADRAELHAALAAAAAGDEVTITLDCRRTLASAATLVPVEDEAGAVAKVLCVLRAR